jgi:hypothetical protein
MLVEALTVVWRIGALGNCVGRHPEAVTIGHRWIRRLNKLETTTL